MPTSFSKSLGKEFISVSGSDQLSHQQKRELVMLARQFSGQFKYVFGTEENLRAQIDLGGPQVETRLYLRENDDWGKSIKDKGVPEQEVLIMQFSGEATSDGADGLYRAFKACSDIVVSSGGSAKLDVSHDAMPLPKSGAPVRKDNFVATLRMVPTWLRRRAGVRVAAA